MAANYFAFMIISAIHHASSTASHALHKKGKHTYLSKKSTHHTWKLPIGDIVPTTTRRRLGRRLGRFTSSVASSHPSILLERNRPKQ